MPPPVIASRTAPSTPSRSDAAGGGSIPPRRTASAREVFIAMCLALAVAAIFGSHGLVGLAQRQDVGTKRDIALGGAEALDRVASAFSLDRPYDWATRAVHGEEATIDIESLLAEPPGQEQSPVPPVVADNEGESPFVPDTPGAGPTALPTLATAVPATASPPTARPSPTTRTITPTDPLHLWVGGDSLSRDLGEGLGRVAPVALVELTFEPQFSSGLSRPDFVNWPQRLAQLVSDEPPDAVAIMFGANDYQSVMYEGTVIDTGTAEWEALYRKRVGEAMDVLGLAPDMTVTWIGLPIMTPGAYPAGGIELMNTIYAEEAASRPWVEFVPTYALFADVNGNYANFLDGVELRVGDGIHLSRSGADRMATAGWANVAARWSLP